MADFSRMCISEINFANTYIARPADYPMHNTGRRRNGFLYTVSGTETYHFYDKTVDAVPGSVLYIPKGEKYTITFKGEESVVKVFDFELTEVSERPFLTVFSDASAIDAAFTKMRARWDKEDGAGRIECKALFYKILGILAKQPELFLPSDKKDIIAFAVEQMHKSCLKSDFRLQSLSEQAGVSHRYFEQLFKQKYGVSPKEYVLNLKIRRAKELLSEKDRKIKDIALELGYGDIYHFGKLFLKKTGYTPREYRKKFH